MLKKTKNIVFIFVIFLTSPCVVADETINKYILDNKMNETLQEVLKQAESFLANNQPIRAFALLTPLADMNAGNPQFDYLLGISALDSGNISVAIFSLERAIAVQANFGGARFELARAYYLANEYYQAKKEFEFSLSLNPPSHLKSLIHFFLKKINAQLNKNPINFETYISLKGGFDNNVNGATENETFLGLLLTPESKAKPSGFMGLSMNNIATYSHDKRTDAYLSAAVFENQYNRASFVNTSGAMSLVGISYKRRKFSSNANISGTAIYLNKNFNTGILRSSAQWNYFLYPSFLLGTNASLSYLKNSSDSALRDRYQGAVKMSGKFSLGLRLPSSFLTAGSFNYEYPKSKNSPYEKFSIAISLETEHYISRENNFFTYSRVNYSNYKRPFFGLSREEGQILLSSGVKIQLEKRLSISPQIKYTKNKSTVSLFDYDRLSANLSMQWKLL